MALLIWAVWVVTKQVQSEKLEVRSKDSTITLHYSNSLNIQQKSSGKTGDFYFLLNLLLKGYKKTFLTKHA